MYHHGEGVEQDLSSHGVVPQSCKLRLGKVSIQYWSDVPGGQGVERDDHQATEWFLKAANQGHSGAQFKVGAMFHNGEGVERDCHQALKWYLKAAKQGEPDAQYYVGRMHHLEKEWNRMVIKPWSGTSRLQIKAVWMLVTGLG